MAITSSPSAPIAGATVALRLTDTTTSFEVLEPVYYVTSAPPDSGIGPGTKLTTKAAPSGAVAYSASNTPRAFSVTLAETAGTWAGSSLVFTSGRLTGKRATIAAHPTATTVELSSTLPLVPQPGDTFKIETSDASLLRLSFVPDVPGEYAITGNSYMEAIAPASFDGDASGQPVRYMRDVQTTTIHVGEVLDLPIVPENGHAITLRLLFTNDSVSAAYLVDPLTTVALAASQDSGVISALQAMVGETASTVGNDLQGTVNNLRTKYEAHRIVTAGSVHAAADSTNTVVGDDAYDEQSAIALLNNLRKTIYAHMTGASAAGSRWHTLDDTKNRIMIAPATTKAEATVLCADLTYRVYESHRVQTASPASHGGSGDTTNSITVTKSDLSELIRVYLNFIAQANPSVPAGLPEGATDARARYGFTKAS